MNGLDQTAWAASGKTLTSRPGIADSPAQEPGTPAESFDPEYDETPSPEYLRGARALLTGLIWGERDR